MLDELSVDGGGLAAEAQQGADLPEVAASGREPRAHQPARTSKVASRTPDTAGSPTRTLEPLTGEQGSITPYAAIFVVVLMLFIGLAVDGGAKLRAGWESVGAAEEAARAGAGTIDRTAVYQGRGFSVDRGAAVRAAQAYLATTGHTGSVAATGPQSITVTVRVTKPTWLLSIVGLSSVSATATATADLVPGVEGAGR